MLFKISYLSSFLFAVMYPLALWLHRDDPLKDYFHRFHTVMPNVVGGVVAIFICTGAFDVEFKMLTCTWIFMAVAVSSLYWCREKVNLILLSIPSLLGCYIYFHLQSALVSSSYLVFLISLLGMAIFVLSLYAMSLGHWYLNVKGLPMKHLERASLAFAVVLMIRFLWNLKVIIFDQVFYDGEMISLIRFMNTLDGIFLYIAFLFGTIFPLGGMWMVKEILKLRNTQATTGVLYVLLCSVIIADMTYKFYLIKYGIAL